MSSKSEITKYPDVNCVLEALTTGITDVLGENLVGIYLMGSLTYDGFNPNNSDIDLVTLVNNPLSLEEIEALKQMHLQIEADNEKWAKRIECAYVSCEMLTNIKPPIMPRPYIGEGVFYPEAPYGNEWIINQYLLYTHGISLVGPDFKALIKSIDIKEVQKACIRDLFQEWKPKLNDLEWLSNSHYQSYIILNLCRILYTVVKGEVASKALSASWAKHDYCPEWIFLIEAAEKWEYGMNMTFQKETANFIQFIINEISETELFKEMKEH